MRNKAKKDLSGQAMLEAENEHLKKILKHSLSQNVTTLNYPKLALDFPFDYSGSSTKGIDYALSLIKNTYDIDALSFISFDKPNQILVSLNRIPFANSDAETSLVFNQDDSISLLSELTQRGYLCGSSNSKKRSWENKFDSIGSFSWLLLPLSNSNFPNALIAFESHKFNREWYPFEIETLKREIISLGNFAEHLLKSEKQSQKEIKTKECLTVLKNIDKTNLVASIQYFKQEYHFESISYFSALPENVQKPLVTSDISDKSFLYTDILQKVNYQGNSIFSKEYYLSEEERGSSYLLIPFYHNEKLLGFMVFILSPETNSLNSYLIDYLKVLVNSVGQIKMYSSSEEKLANDNLFLRNTIQSLNSQKQLFDTIANVVPAGIFIVNNSVKVLYVNNYIQSLLGYHKVDLLEKDITNIFDHSQSFIIQLVEDVISSGVDYSGEFELTKQNSESLNVELFSTPIEYKNEICSLISIRDISIRKQHENKLTHTELEFKALTQNSPDIIVRLNREGQIQYFNSALINEFSFIPHGEILGKDFVELNILDPLVANTWQAKINDVFAYGTKQSMEMGFTNEFTEIYFDWNLIPHINKDGSIHNILAYGRNLTPRKIAENQLTLAKQKAEESDRLKTSFLANMSHELRTPLNAIVGFSSLLKEGDLGTQEREEYIDLVLKNSDSLMMLINNIMDTAKVESGKISITKESVNINHLLRSIVDEYKNIVEVEHKGRVKLCLDIPNTDSFHIVSDSIRLNQVFSHLIQNAIKFTIKGYIEIGYKIENSEVQFFVRDTGIGISQAKQKVIFEPFRQEEEDTSLYYGGTGIGLALCDKLIHALGGQIGLNSEKSVGSEFFFTHPIEEPKLDISETVQPNKIVTFTEPIVPKEYNWPNKLVLLVDENSSAHIEMRKYIEKTGLTLVSARTASGANQLVRNRNDIHLVLMELEFSDFTGTELLTAIKSNNKSLPVIAYSHAAVNGTCSKLMESGFDKCIAKPASRIDLLDAMDDYLALKV